MNLLLIISITVLIVYEHVLQISALTSYLHLRKGVGKTFIKKSLWSNGFLRGFLGISLLDEKTSHCKWLSQVLLIINLDFLSIPLMIIMSILVITSGFPQKIIYYYVSGYAIKHCLVLFFIVFLMRSLSKKNELKKG